MLELPLAKITRVAVPGTRPFEFSEKFKMAQKRKTARCAQCGSPTGVLPMWKVKTVPPRLASDPSRGAIADWKIWSSARRDRANDSSRRHDLYQSSN